MFGLHHTLLTTFLTAFLLVMVGNRAIAEPLGEYEAKTAYIYNFTLFVEWPHGAFHDEADTFRLCVLGEDVTHGLLEVLEEKKVKSHPIEVVYLTVRNEQTINECHLVFVSNPSPYLTQLKEIEAKPILTISDNPGPCIIELVLTKKKIRFKIYQDRARHASLFVKAQLLSLALPN